MVCRVSQLTFHMMIGAWSPWLSEVKVMPGPVSLLASLGPGGTHTPLKIQRHHHRNHYHHHDNQHEEDIICSIWLITMVWMRLYLTVDNWSNSKPSSLDLTSKERLYQCLLGHWWSLIGTFLFYNLSGWDRYMTIVTHNAEAESTDMIQLGLVNFSQRSRLAETG